MLSAPIWMSAEVNPAVLGHVVPTRLEATPANALLEGQGILTVLKDVHQPSLRVSFIFIAEKITAIWYYILMYCTPVTHISIILVVSSRHSCFYITILYLVLLPT